jgi:hypothetical protein
MKKIYNFEDISEILNDYNNKDFSMMNIVILRVSLKK